MNHDPLAKRGERILQKMRQRYRGPRIVIPDTKEDPWGRPWRWYKEDAAYRMSEFDQLPRYEKERIWEEDE